MRARGEDVADAGRRALPGRRSTRRRRVAERCGVPAETIRSLAREMAHVAFNEAITLPVRWTDVWGREHDTVTGRPVAMYAMRGISAHSNGFHTCRALHFIQMLLGALDGPGNFRARAPYPKPIPPKQLPANQRSHPNLPLGGTPLGFPDASRGSRDRRGRHAAAHRQGLLVGIAARRARPDAHGDRERRRRRSVSDRHADAVHGEHGVELGDEHRAHAREPAREGRERRRTGSRSSSSATRSGRRPSRSPISCFPTRRTSSATTRSACSTGRSPSPMRRPTRSAIR